jgi:hypothetical protein
MKTAVFLRNVLGTIALMYGGYIVLSAMPDFRRYLRISTM